MVDELTLALFRKSGRTMIALQEVDSPMSTYNRAVCGEHSEVPPRVMLAKVSTLEIYPKDSPYRPRCCYCIGTVSVPHPDEVYR